MVKNLFCRSIDWSLKGSDKIIFVQSPVEIQLRNVINQKSLCQPYNFFKSNDISE